VLLRKGRDEVKSDPEQNHEIIDPEVEEHLISNESLLCGRYTRRKHHWGHENTLGSKGITVGPVLVTGAERIRPPIMFFRITVMQWPKGIHSIPETGNIDLCPTLPTDEP
jgi:hypothetical protein